MICEATGAGPRPSRRQTSASMWGGRWAKVPTAPDSLPTLTTALARRTRSMARPISAYQSASFRPNVIGSACTPCVLPIIGVCRCSMARSRTTSESASRSFRMTSQASRICSAWAVSMTSDDVIPKCSQRADGPMCSATAVVNATTSCCAVCSICSIRAISNAPPLADIARRFRRDEAGRRHRVGGGGLHEQPGLVSSLVAPDPPYLGMCVTWNHGESPPREKIEDTGAQTRSGCSSTSSASSVVYSSYSKSIRSRGTRRPFTFPSTVAASEPLWNRFIDTRWTSSAVTRSISSSVSSNPNCRSK